MNLQDITSQVAILDREIAQAQQIVQVKEAKKQQYHDELFEALYQHVLMLHPSADTKEKNHETLNVWFFKGFVSFYAERSGYYNVYNNTKDTEFDNYVDALFALEQAINFHSITVKDIQNMSVFNATKCNMTIIPIPYGWSASPQKQLYYIVDEYFKPYSNAPNDADYWVEYLSKRYIKSDKIIKVTNK